MMLKKIALTIVVCGLVLSLDAVGQDTADQETAKQSLAVDPPQILVVESIDSDDHLVLVSYHSIFIGFEGYAYNERLTTKVSLTEVKIRTADGGEITSENARKRISGRDTAIIVTSYQSKLPKFYATMFDPQTLHFSFPKKAPQWKTIESPGSPIEK